MRYLEILAASRKPVSTLTANDVLTNPKYAARAWANWKNTQVYKEMAVSSKYFQNKNTFMEAFKRKSLYSVKGNSAIAGSKTAWMNYDDLYKSEIRIKHPLFADMVNQITDFILGNDYVFESEDGELEKFHKELKSKFDLHHLFKLQLKEKLIKAYSGTNFRLENEKVIVEPLPAEAFGFFYESSTKQEADYIISSLSIEQQFLAINEKTQKESWQKMKVEKYLVISKQGIAMHIKNPETKQWVTEDLSFIKGESRPVAQILEDGSTLITEENISEEKIIPPFIPYAFMTTETLESELFKVKELIDALDINDSDAMTELINLIKTLWVIKGAEGTSAEEALDLIKAGVLNLDGEGADAKKLEGSSATDERIKMSDKLLEKFYRFSKTVDLEKLKSLSNTSGVAIAAMFEPLNQKSKDIETELSRYIKDFVKKAYMVQNITDEAITASLEDTFKDVKITFHHSMIINEQEQLTANALQVGKVPEEVRLKKHPWLQDKTSDEIKEIIKEQEAKEIVE